MRAEGGEQSPRKCPLCQGVRAEGYTCPRCNDTGLITDPRDPKAVDAVLAKHGIVQQEFNDGTWSPLPRGAIALATEIVALKAALVEALGKINDLAAWKDSAVAACAKRQCSMRDNRLKDAEIEIAALQSQLAEARGKAENGRPIHGVTWVVIREGHVLLERCPKKARVLGVGEWFVPGGKIEGDESSVSALIREVREEWPGCHVDRATPLPVLEGSPVDATPPKGTFLMRPFLVEITGEIPNESSEGIPLRWAPIEEALASPVPQVRMMVAAALPSGVAALTQDAERWRSMAEVSDERVDSLLDELDAVARDIDSYAYGLPLMTDEGLPNMRTVVHGWLQSTADALIASQGKNNDSK